MSSESTPVTAARLAYLAARTRGDDDFLRQLKSSAATAGIPQIWISPEQASLMQILLRLRGAREVVEVGTLAGYSAIWMARALPAGGRVRTIEIEPVHADFAAARFEESDVSDRIELHRGDARAVLAGFGNESADACFIDADKESYGHYLEECLRILRPHGLVMVDNAFGFGNLPAEGRPDDSVAAIAAFNDAVAARSDLQALIVPLGDGCWVGCKLAAGGSSI